MAIRRKFDKVEIARRQLGVALQLFIDDEDPVSVHSLAAAGAEIAHGLAEASHMESFRAVAIEANPALTSKKYNEIRTQFWNGFKHYTDFKGTLRDDSDLFATFSDEVNEHMLLIGWLDLGQVMGCLPIEAQGFQGWFFVRHPDLLEPEDRPVWHDVLFPNINSLPRKQHKAQLRKAIQRVKRRESIVSSSLTDRRKLLLPNNIDELDR